MSSREETLERLRAQVEEEQTDEEQEIDEETVSALDEVLEDAEPKKGSSREYRIISKWTDVAVVEATSAQAALDQLDKNDGSFAVIPVRNFSAFEIEVETVQKKTITPIE